MKEIKKYLIGFIVGLMSVGSITYAADSGSIGALFEKIGTEWFLDGSNIKDASVSEAKLDSALGNKITQISTNQTDISNINSSINLGSNWTIVNNGTNLEFQYNGTTKITFASDGSITATQYNLN